MLCARHLSSASDFPGEDVGQWVEHRCTNRNLPMIWDNVSPSWRQGWRSFLEQNVRGDLPYPEELIEKVVSATGLTGRDSVLDFGCGLGLLAVAFAPFVSKVAALDCDPAVLEEAAAYARSKRVAVNFKRGNRFQLDTLANHFHLVTLGPSFYRTDRLATLLALDRVVLPFGGLALFRDSHPAIPQNLWHKRLAVLLRSHTQTERSFSLTGEKPPPHEYFLLQSGFRRLERISIIQKIDTPVSEVMDYATTVLSGSPDWSSGETKTVLSNLREILNQQATDGVLAEFIESEALLAHRKEP
jgi:ubiquinone/menaquinone biosynthesis C-methylase UbiE